MTFRDVEKARYASIKPHLFSPEACVNGLFRGITRDFCLAGGHSAENIYEGFRPQAIEYFRRRKIPWHNGIRHDGETHPSNHLCCSQTFCVNTLWPMVEDADLLKRVFGTFLPQLDEPLAMTADKPLPDGKHPTMAFEWIGTQNYLNEHRWGTRGANTTSADFAFRFRRDDGRIQLVLGEWKYTEYYGKGTPLSTPTHYVRKNIYREAFLGWCAGRADLPDYATLFVEPFYQLMRLTLLAHEMELSRLRGDGELEADVVTVLHITPEANHELADNFKAAPLLRDYGRTITEAWSRIAGKRFLSVSTEQFLSTVDQVAGVAYRNWSEYLLERYGWWR